MRTSLHSIFKDSRETSAFTRGKHWQVVVEMIVSHLRMFV